MDEHEHYQSIETRYGLSLPNEYRQMQSRGWFDSDQESYVWLHEAEWLSLEEIAHYKFKPQQRSGFVPFALNEAGDLWCWWPQAAAGETVPIAWCLHDDDMGVVVAPHFIGFIYRQIVESCMAGYALDESENRRQLQQWHDRFSEFLPVQWSNNLLALMEQKPLTEAECEAILQRDLAFERFNQRFQWMK